jgi:hypothetical protein
LKGIIQEDKDTDISKNNDPKVTNTRIFSYKLEFRE